jgi:4-hydroxy-3-polyprenylbenzoate decarboxylase
MSDSGEREKTRHRQRLCTRSDIPVTVGWTGASGFPYGERLVEVLLAHGYDVHLVHSSAVKLTAPVEAGRPLDAVLESLREASCEGRGDTGCGRLHLFSMEQYSAPMASGSAPSRGLVICPCSMGTAGRLAAGTSDNLLLRAADVCLKERRPLVVVPREAPMATHHLENLARLSALGAVVLPAAPGFYHRPETVGDLVDFVVQRICDHLGVEVELTRRWGVDPGTAQPVADEARTADAPKARKGST